MNIEQNLRNQQVVVSHSLFFVGKMRSTVHFFPLKYGSRKEVVSRNAQDANGLINRGSSSPMDTWVVIQNICPFAYIILLDWKVFYFSYELFPCGELRQRGKKEPHHINPSQGSLDRPKLPPQRTLSWSLKTLGTKNIVLGHRKLQCWTSFYQNLARFVYLTCICIKCLM